MALKGDDEAWDRPSGSSLQAAGFKVSSLYVGQDNTGKNMTKAVVDDYHRHGVAVITNFEYGAQQMLGGAAQASTDITMGLSQAKACGMPSGRPMYDSADFDATQTQISGAIIPYLVRHRSISGPGTVGVYGSYYIVKAAHEYWAAHFPGEKIYLWQTVGWSGGLVYDAIDIYQNGTTQNVAGIPVDNDSILTADAGQWPAPAAPPIPVPPAHAPLPQDEHMILLSGFNGPAVAALSGGLLWDVKDGVAVNGYKAAGVQVAQIDAGEYANIQARVAAGAAVPVTVALDASALAAALVAGLPSANDIALALAQHLGADLSQGK